MSDTHEDDRRFEIIMSYLMEHPVVSYSLMAFVAFGLFAFTYGFAFIDEKDNKFLKSCDENERFALHIIVSAAWIVTIPLALLRFWYRVSKGFLFAIARTAASLFKGLYSLLKRLGQHARPCVVYVWGRMKDRKEQSKDKIPKATVVREGKEADV